MCLAIVNFELCSSSELGPDPEPEFPLDFAAHNARAAGVKSSVFKV
jgi:hypothetical protein